MDWSSQLLRCSDICWKLPGPPKGSTPGQYFESPPYMDTHQLMLCIRTNSFRSWKLSWVMSGQKSMQSMVFAMEMRWTARPWQPWRPCHNDSWWFHLVLFAINYFLCSLVLKFELLGVSASVAMKNRSHLSTVLMVDLKHDAMRILVNTAEKYGNGEVEC